MWSACSTSLVYSAGDAGSHVVTLLAALAMPIVTTLHTILTQPSPVQRRVLREIVDMSTSVVVMADKGRELLRTGYDVAADKVEIIPHGIPNCAFAAPEAAKLSRGFAGKAVILTFGLISPNKGIEITIEAMPAILRSRPDAVYIVLGATHPHLVRSNGERYRESLKRRTRELGIETQVLFLDQFVDQATLVDFISMCDVCVTPYLNEAQMTSGTLANGFGLGKAVVSTPYWHAQELLADGRGILVPFGDSAATGAEIAALLTDDAHRLALRKVAYAHSRSMTWQRSAKRYLATFERAINRHGRSLARQSHAEDHSDVVRLPPRMQLSHLFSMCDATGLYRRAIHSVPDRSHGYCVADNARGLLLACALNTPGEELLPARLTATLAAFVQQAWNPATRRFRDFMTFERRWLAATGSEDTHGRILWALGESACNDPNPERSCWAAALLAEAAPIVASFESPRAWAFTLLGLGGFRAMFPDDTRAAELQQALADRLLSILMAVETPSFVWFQDGTFDDNAHLPQALIVTGVAVGNRAYVAAGLRSLRWITALQTAENGLFRPVGCRSFGDVRRHPREFDQQPLEATATVSACLSAWRADADPLWKAHAAHAFEWFLGNNDLSTPLVDEGTGSCCDGLHPGRVDANMGGESVVSYLLALAEIRGLVRSTLLHTQPALLRALRAQAH